MEASSLLFYTEPGPTTVAFRVIVEQEWKRRTLSWEKMREGEKGTFTLEETEIRKVVKTFTLGGQAGGKESFLLKSLLN